MTWFMLPAVIGIIIKIYLLANVKNAEWITAGLIGFVSVLLLHNLSEILLFNSLLSGLDAEFVIRTYYVCTVAVLIYGLYYVTDFEKFPQTKFLAAAVSALGVGIALLIFGTDYFIAGAAPIAYTITAIQGEGYWLFQAYILICLVTWITCLFLNYKKATSPKEEIRYFYGLVALSPLVVASFAIIAMMNVGIAVNATVIIPLASTLFLIVLIRGNNSHAIDVDLRQVVPFTLERTASNQIKIASSQYNLENMSHKDFMMALEKAVIEYKFLKNGKNTSKTAASMQIERSTLYGKFKALKIQFRDEVA